MSLGFKIDFFQVYKELIYELETLGAKIVWFEGLRKLYLGKGI
jgi:hypothetical protein